MKKFIVKILLYLLPVLLFFSVPYYILKASGELSDLSSVAIQKEHLVGLAYSDQSKDYKLQEILTRRPEILAVGTSRVLQIRSFFFRSPETFYNGGRLISRLGDLPCLIEEWDKKNYKPEVILLGLDQYFFNKNWDDLRERCEYNTEISEMSMLSSSSLDVYSDLIDGKIQLRNILRSYNRYGITAMMNNAGYRTEDGSYYYGKIIEDFKNGVKISFRDIEKRIASGRHRFEWGNDVNNNAVDLLKVFIDYCGTNNIKLIMFIPPYPASIYKRMIESGKYGYVLKLDSSFSANRLKVHNFISLDSIGSKDDEAVDGLHGSEVAYLRLIQELCKREPWLEKYVDQKQFELLSNPANPLELKEEKY